MEDQQAKHELVTMLVLSELGDSLNLNRETRKAGRTPIPIGGSESVI